jgi:hypothetical protein
MRKLSENRKKLVLSRETLRLLEERGGASRRRVDSRLYGYLPRRLYHHQDHLLLSPLGPWGHGQRSAPPRHSAFDEGQG